MNWWQTALIILGSLWLLYDILYIILHIIFQQKITKIDIILLIFPLNWIFKFIKSFIELDI